MIQAKRGSKGFVMTDALRALAAVAVERNATGELLQRDKNQSYAFFELHKDLPGMERMARSLATGLSCMRACMWAGTCGLARTRWCIRM